MKKLPFLLFLPAAILFAEQSSLQLQSYRIEAGGGLKELIKEDVLARLKNTDSSYQLSSDASTAKQQDKTVLTLAPEKELKGKNAIPLLWKGVIIAVSRKNPYRNLTREEAGKILKNEFPFWPETDIPVKNIYYLPHIFEAGKAPGKKGKTHLSPVRFADVAEKLMEHDPKAIVLLPLSHAMAPPSTLKLLSLDGIRPDFENITGGRYPLQEKYCLKIYDDAPEEVSGLAQKLLSPSYKQKILDFGSIPIKTTNGDAKK